MIVNGQKSTAKVIYEKTKMAKMLKKEFSPFAKGIRIFLVIVYTFIIMFLPATVIASESLEERIKSLCR